MKQMFIRFVIIVSALFFDTSQLHANWEEASKVLDSEAVPMDQFGWSVAIDGDYAIVGACYEDDDADGDTPLDDAGSAYIFIRNGGSWNFQQKIVANDRTEDDQFGYSVAISGNTVIIGARYEDEDAGGSATLANAGSAYVFVRNGTTWNFQQKLVASDRYFGDWFGHSVSINDDTVVVGAKGKDNGSGSAYIFVRSSTIWTQQQKLIAPVAAHLDHFGESVSISGNTVIIGASDEDEDASDDNTLYYAGSAYVFVRNSTTWSLQQKLVAPDRAGSDYFGYSVAISGDTAVIGAYQCDVPLYFTTKFNAGAAYVFVRTNTSWTMQQKLVASDRDGDDFFGVSVGINKDSIIVGASYEDEDASGDNALNYAGSAYIFNRSGTHWSQKQKIVASDRAESDHFGCSVAISGNTAISGANSNNGSRGAAYLFSKTDVNPALLIYLLN